MKKLLYKISAKFPEILGIINNNFKPNLVQEFSKIKVYKALAVPTLLYGSQIWILRKKGQH
jgi:hypothetical protein